MKKYQEIFKELKIKNMTLKNRIVMPPMGTNFANLDGSFNQKHIEYYVQRAKGGVGLITLENVCIDFPLGSNGTTQLRIDNDQYLPGLYEFNEKMHEYGACTSVQINHAGASAYPLRLSNQTPVSSSDVPSKVGGIIPRSLTIDEINHIINKYAESANRAKRAGFDAVEIHAGHSYLLSQFLSPIYNKRTDEFGGSLENRARLTKCCIEAVRKAVGPHFSIVLRISADEFVEGGNKLDDTLKILDYLVKEVDIINVSAALNPSIQYQIDKMELPDGWRAYMAKKVKEKYKDKIIMTSGNFRSPKSANEVIKDGAADLVAMGRGLIAEPNWVNKVQSGNEDLLRKCISCNIGCADHRIAKSKPIRCTVNPDVIYEDSYKQVKVNKALKMVVIGGGTAGLEAATTATEVGVNTTLFEQKDYLGGLATQIARFPSKKRINDFVSYLENRSKELSNLNIKLNTKVSVEDIKKLSPDIIVNATGSKALLPPIKGLSEQLKKPDKKVFTIIDLLDNLDKFKNFEDKKVAVVGGGAVGLDVMEYFSYNNAKQVDIIEMQPQLGTDLDMITRVSMMEIANKYKVNQHINTKLIEVGSDYFLVEKDNQQVKIEFDLGFVCLGMKAHDPLVEELKIYADEVGAQFVNLGDSKLARRIMEGTKEARDIIRVIERCL